MRLMPWKNEPSLTSILLSLAMTTLGALANYALKIISGEIFSWRTLFLQLIVSLFSGSLMWLLLHHYAVTDDLAGAVCGLAGWSGASLIKTLEKKLLDKFQGGQV